MRPMRPQRRRRRRMELSEPDLLVQGGLVFARGRVARLEHFDAFTLIIALREGMKLTVPLDQQEELLKTLFALPRLPRLDLPEDLRVEESRPAAKPRLTVKKPSQEQLLLLRRPPRRRAVVRLRRAGRQGHRPAGRDPRARRPAASSTVTRRRSQRPGRSCTPWGSATRSATASAPRRRRPAAAAEQAAEGGRRADRARGGTSRPRASSTASPASSSSSVSSGIDWFELHGEVDFGGADALACPSCWRRCAAARTMRHARTTARSACCPRSG